MEIVELDIVGAETEMEERKSGGRVDAGSVGRPGGDLLIKVNKSP